MALACNCSFVGFDCFYNVLIYKSLWIKASAKWLNKKIKSAISGPPLLVRSIWERWTGRSCAPSPLHFSHSICARHILSKQGCQFANSPHSYMIDNRKLLSGADLIFFQVLVPPSTCHEKMPAARFTHAKNRHWEYAWEWYADEVMHCKTRCYKLHIWWFLGGFGVEIMPKII